MSRFQASPEVTAVRYLGDGETRRSSECADFGELGVRELPCRKSSLELGMDRREQREAKRIDDQPRRFAPGIVVTTSGLEFDAVVIPDLSPTFYPASPELARALYVAATRARDWLWLLTAEAWSPLVLGTSG